jgi:DNA processing protein
VVVEAPEHSGALITARHALDAGRDVWAVPGPPGVRECRGSNGLLADGAGVLWDIPEFVDAIAREHRVPVAKGGASGGAQPLPAGLENTEAAVLCGVGFEPRGVDEVAKKSGVTMPEVLTALAMLELKGFVSRDGVGSYVRRTVP